MPTLSKDAFQTWRNNPVTEMVHRYLKHREDRQRQEWAQGQAWTPESRVLVSLLSDIEALSFEDIAEFYGDTDPVTIPGENVGLYPEKEE